MRVRLHSLLMLLVLTALMACTVTPSPLSTGTPTETSVEPTEESASSPTPSPTETATATPAEEATAPPTVEPTVPPPTETPPPESTQVPFEPVVGLELVAEGLTAPVSMASPGDGSGRLFIADQIGVIRVLTAEGELLGEPFLDIRDRMVALNPGYDEKGLLGLAFSPDYEDSGLFAVYYSAPLADDGPAGWNHTSHLSWFAVSQEDPTVADPDSEQLMLQVHQPQGNHNGGDIAFGPDGYLYVALGDGGGANDVGIGHVEDWYEANRGGNGQDVDQNLLGSLLRVDVVGGDPYVIPEDNPFAADGGRGEIWAYGFRNPWRFSFDAAGDREMFVADVGQNLWEEVSIATSGGNYGWNVKEGSHCFSAASPSQPPAECPDTDPEGDPLINPIIEYQNGNAPGGLGLAVVGGYVYRGQALRGFEGRYVFGDWSTGFGAPDGTLLAASPPGSGGGRWSFQELEIATHESGDLGAYLLAFGQDARNELYALTSGMAGPSGRTGRVWRIVPPE